VPHPCGLVFARVGLSFFSLLPRFSPFDDLRNRVPRFFSAGFVFNFEPSTFNSLRRVAAL
jgi:hypothetical protein